MVRYPDSRLTQAMIDAARATRGGQLIDHLLAEENARGGDTSLGGGASIIQQIWGAMMDAQRKGK